MTNQEIYINPSYAFILDSCKGGSTLLNRLTFGMDVWKEYDDLQLQHCHASNVHRNNDIPNIEWWYIYFSTFIDPREGVYIVPSVVDDDMRPIHSHNLVIKRLLAVLLGPSLTEYHKYTKKSPIVEGGLLYGSNSCIKRTRLGKIEYNKKPCFFFCIYLTTKDL